MLGAIVDLAKGFDTDIAEIRHSQEEQVQEMMDNLQGIIRSLHEVNDQVLTIITDMNTIGETLMADIYKSLGEFRVKERMEADINKARETMDILLSGASKALPENYLWDKDVYLRHLDTIYTMKSERDVHMRHKKNDDETDTACKEDASQGLGDNVELF